MNSNEYAEAYAEVIDIIKHMDYDLINKIPKKVIKFFEENSSKEYNVNFDYSKGLKKLNLKPKTSSVIAIIFLKYLCNEEQKKNYIKILDENEKNYQQKLNEKYSYENLFKKN